MVSVHIFCVKWVYVCDVGAGGQNNSEGIAETGWLDGWLVGWHIKTPDMNYKSLSKYYAIKNSV